MNQYDSNIHVAVLRPIDSLRYAGTILGHDITIERKGYTDPCLFNGERLGAAVRYLPEGLDRDDLALVADGGRIVISFTNGYTSFPASRGFPFEETYEWATRGKLDGRNLVIGRPSDAPLVLVDWKPSLCLLILAYHDDSTETRADDRPDFVTEPYVTLTPEPGRLGRPASVENEDRAYRARWARLLAIRQSAIASFEEERAARLEAFAEAIDRDLEKNPAEAVEEIA